jgi:hypothetical protein
MYVAMAEYKWRVFMMSVEVGLAVGMCPKCRREIARSRPADFAVCDCWEYCPKGHRMEPYSPDLTLETYGPITGKVSGDLKSPLKIVMWCPICRYYSAQLPVEVRLE